MKILAVLALLIAFCSASSSYQNMNLVHLANGTQSTSYTNSPGTCTFTATYTDSTTTLAGTFTCTGLQGNITAVHIHDCGSTVTVTFGTGNPVPDCTITVNSDMQSGSWSCAFTGTSTTMDSLCNDQCYYNVHTTWDPVGEVRCNIVNMRSLCRVSGGISIDAAVTVVGSAPSTGVKVADFYVAIFGYPLVGTGGGYAYIAWDSVNGILTISGVTYGLSSDVYGIFIEYPDDSIYFIYLSALTFPTNCPFSFRYTGCSDWEIAKVTSGVSYITVDTANNINGELQVNIAAVGSSFPSNQATCVPYTQPLPTTALTCNYGSSSYSYSSTCGSTDYFCAIYDSAGLEVRTCSTWQYCYDCACGADVTKDLTSSGYACCNKDNCNDVSLAVLNCLYGNGAGSFSAGVLVSLFVALFMKWFN